VKLNIRRVLIFLLILALSVAFGFGFDAAATALEKHRYPQKGEFAAFLRADTEEFGIPETILWAAVRTESGFVSNLVSADGSIGLMQLTPEQFHSICSNLLHEGNLETGMLYDPETNLRCGSARISFLYQRYGVWKTVYAAMATDTETVDQWLTDPKLTDELGMLAVIPDRAAASYVREMEKAVRMYGELYDQS